MADRYWVGGTGDWNDTAHWSASSGGASGASVPTTADDAFFDANSSAVSYTANLLALSVSFRNFSVTAKPATGELTISGSGASANIYGAVSVDVDVVAGSMLGQLVNFYGTTSIKIPAGMYLARTCYIQTGTLTFQSNLQMLLNWSSTFYRVGASSVDANGYKLTMSSDPASARGITGDMTLHDLEVVGGGYFNFNGNITLTGTLTIPGLAANNPIFITSGALGTKKTLTAAAVALGYVHFMDIGGDGVAAPFTGMSLGDCLGNSGITFTPAADQYFYAPTPGTKAWSSVGNWFLGSGGTGGAGRVPLPQDNVIFDANSIGAASTIISADMPRSGKDWTFTGVANSPHVALAANVFVHGSFTLGAGMTLAVDSSLAFSGRGSHTLNFAGVNLTNVGTVYIYKGVGGTYTATSAISMSGPFALLNGTFVDAGYSVTALSWSMTGTEARGLNATGNWTLTGVWAGWAATTTTNLTVISMPATVRFTDITSATKPFNGGSKTYNNVWFASATRFAITGSNTFADFKADPGAIIQNTAGTVQTAATWHIDGREATGSDAPEVLFDINSACHLTTPHKAGHPVADMSWVVAARIFNHASGTNQTLIGKYLSAGANSAWMFETVSSGTVLRLYYTIAGTTYSAASSSHGLSNGVLAGYGVKRNATTGSITFYKTTDLISWTPISTVAGVAGNLDNPAIGVECGSFASGVAGRLGGAVRFGRVYSGDFFAGSPTLEIDLNPSLYNGSGDTVTASTGEVWTRNGNAQFTATNLTTIMGATNAAFTLAKSGGGVVACRDLSIRNATASPAATFYAGAASFDGGGNTNWLWQDIAMLSGDAAAAAAASGALDSGIALAGVSLSVAGAGGTLTTAIPLAAAAVAVSTADGIFNAQITLSGAALAEAAAAAGLDTGIPLDGLAGGAAAASGTLTVQIVLAGDAAAAAGAGGELSAQVQLSAVAIAQAVASGSLTTEIPLAAFAQAQASVVADFVTRPRIRGYRLESSHARTTQLISRDVRIEQ